MSEKAKYPVVVPENARNERYRKDLKLIFGSGKCPFCEDGTTMIDERQKTVCKTESWIVKLNYEPVSGARLHFLIISRYHVFSLIDLQLKAYLGLQDIYKWLEENYDCEGFVIYVRCGDPLVTGATVPHLHVHFVVPEDGQAVTIRFGPPPKE